jgi:DGQHR domain-containing protein
MKIANISHTFIEYHALRGTYGRVTYFVTKTSLRDAAENLTLAPQDTLTFSERIQRVVNIRRVEKEIVPYLEKNDLRFFNALVCILLPDSNKQDGFWDFEEYKDEHGTPIGGLGKLRIVKEVGRIVLDGQHRFVALQQYWRMKKDTPAKDANIDVALVFVVVDSLGRIGSPTPNLRAKTIEAVRNLFAVLNKTARSVDKATLLLIDDSDIFNVMTRSLLEEKKINEMYVKWTSGENLQPKDVFFSTLNVIRDSIAFYLRDQTEELEIDCGTDDERSQLMQKFYVKTPGVEVPVSEGIPFIFEKTEPYKNWLKETKRLRVHIPLQPETSEIDRRQGKELEKLRMEALCYTVAGQKAFYRAIIEVFKSQPRRDVKTLESVCKRASYLIEKGFFSRKPEAKNPFLNLLFDSRSRMSWAENPVDLTRRIFAVALGSPSDRKAILQDYRDQTDNDESIVVEYWEKVASIVC